MPAEAFRVLPEEVRLARLDESLASVRDIRERFHNRLTRKGLSLCENYLEGRLKFGIDYELVEADGLIDGGNEVASVVVRLEISHPQRKLLLANDRHHLFDGHSRDRWNNQFVFVENVEIVKGPQGMFPATVGFQLLNHSECIGRGPLHLSINAPPLGRRVAVAGFYEFAPIYSGREIRVRRLPRADRRGREHDRYMIEDGSKVVDGVANSAEELHRHDALSQEYNLSLPVFEIGPENEIVFASAGEFLGGVCHLKKVSLGPFEL